MTSESIHDDDGSRLGDLVEEILARLADDPAFSVESFLTGHPRQAAALRNRLDALNRFGLSDDVHDRTSPKLERYEVGESLGRGGMGEVFRARDRHLGRDVALKRIRSDLDRQLLEARFANEARLGSRLDHPAIPPVFDFLADAAPPCYTMKLVAGRTLREVLGDEPARGRALRRIAEVLETICEALSHAHAAGIVHRDLKPGNVMLGDYGEVHVLDWGIALDLSGAGPEESERSRRVALLSDRSEARAGTGSYMAPEQAAGELEAIGPRTDVFGIGALLFRALTGTAPFPNDTEARDPSAPDGALDRLDATAGIPPELRAVCRTAMADDPAERYPDTETLAEDLRAWRDGASRGFAWQDGAVHRFVKGVARRPQLAALALVVAVAVGLGAIAWSGWQRELIAIQQRAELLRTLDDAELQVREAGEVETGFGPTRQLTEYSAAIDEILDALARLDVTITNPSSIDRLLSRLPPHKSAPARELLRRATFDLTRYLTMSGLWQAAGVATDRGDPGPLPVDNWKTMATNHPRAVDVTDQILGFAEAIPMAPEAQAAIGALEALALGRATTWGWTYEAGSSLQDDELFACAWTAQRIRGPAAAAEIWPSILEARPDLFFAHMQYAVHLQRVAMDPRSSTDVQQDAWNRALQEARIARALWPGSATALSLQAVALSKLGRTDAALQTFRLLLEQHPDHVAGNFNLAQNLLARGERDAALARLETVLHSDPDDCLALLLAGKHGLEKALEAEDHDLARRSLDRMRLACTAPSARQNWIYPFELGLGLGVMERPGEAVEAFRRALACIPTDADDVPNLKFNLAQELMFAGHPAETLAICDDLQSNHGFAWKVDTDVLALRLEANRRLRANEGR